MEASVTPSGVKMPKVRSKAEFFRLSQEMVFGNRLQQFGWKLFDEMFQDCRNARCIGREPWYDSELPPMPEKVSVRNVLAGGDERVQRYRLGPAFAHAHCVSLIKTHIVTPEQLILDESAPDHLVTLQAEVRNSERFIDMRFALHSGVGMRPAYAAMKPVSGIRAVTILKEYLDAPSWDNLCEILHVYSESVVELSSYSVPVGVLGLSTIIWEVRNY
jgi:hypothetical protein